MMLFLNLQHTVNPVKTELLWLEIDKCLVYTILSSVVRNRQVFGLYNIVLSC
jgi:hypothetical protein